MISHISYLDLYELVFYNLDIIYSNDYKLCNILDVNYILWMDISFMFNSLEEDTTIFINLVTSLVLGTN
jgi:hypothetical protein